MKQIKFKPIEEKDMNDRLVNLYGSHIPYLYTEIKKIYMDDNYAIKPAAPLLIELSDESEFPYEKGELKVMVFGRENNNWNDNGEGRRNNTQIYTELSTYNFNIENSEDILTEIRGKHSDESGNTLPEEQEMYGLTDIYLNYCNGNENSTTFTRRMNQFLHELENKTGKKVGLVWNNIFKIGKGKKGHGKCCGMPPAYIRNIEKETFDIIKNEIEILKPDIIIFMTGSKADNAIKEKLGLTDDFQVIDSDLPNLLRVDIPGVKYAARTPHPSDRPFPNTLRSKYNEALIKDIMNTIL